MPFPHPMLNLCLFTSAADGKLDYDAFFSSRIQAKKSDNSYRKFRVLARSAEQFPKARHYPTPGGGGRRGRGEEAGRDVTVWCSNDYLGMSKHPAVIQATV